MHGIYSKDDLLDVLLALDEVRCSNKFYDIDRKQDGYWAI